MHSTTSRQDTRQTDRDCSAWNRAGSCGMMEIFRLQVVNTHRLWVSRVDVNVSIDVCDTK
jgi:hypothetical protein